MIGYDAEYGYEVQVETIDGVSSYVTGHRTRQDALASARRHIASRHAGTALSGRDCTVLIHTPYASYLAHRRPGHTDAELEAAR